MTHTIRRRIPVQQDTLSYVIADRGVPRITAGAISRQRLLARVDRLLPLTVLRAPYGYGKTTLAAQWVATLTSTPTAWVSVGPKQVPPAEFWRQVHAVLPDASAGATGREALIDALRGPGTPLVLVIDDLDRVDDTSVVADLLELLRRYPRLHLVATTQSDVLDPSDWLDLDGQVLNAADLGFSRTETRAVLTRLCGETPQDLETISRELGGWPIAVRAFGLAWRAATDSDHRTPHTLHTVREQLSHAVLTSFDEPTMNGLVLPTVLVDGFSATDLTDLLDRPDPPADLALLTNHGLLGAEGPRGERSYTWPGIVRDAVLEANITSRPGLIRQIRTSLADRYLQRGDVAAALEQAANAEDWALVRRIFEAHWAQLFLPHYDLVGRILRTSPTAALGDSVLIQSFRAVHDPDEFGLESLNAQLPVGEADIEEWIRRARPRSANDLVAAIVITFRILGRYELAREAASKAPAIVQAVLRDDPEHLIAPGAAVSLQCGLVWLHCGEARRAIAEFERSHHYGDRSFVGHLKRDSAAKLALTHGLLGEHPASRTWVARAEAAPFPDTWASQFISTSLATAQAFNAISVLDRRAALDAISPSNVLHPREELWAIHQYARARVAVLWGSPSSAARELESIASRSLPAPSAYMEDLLLAARVDLALRRGLGSRCSALLAESTSTAPVVQVRRARIALLTGAASEAVALARKASDHDTASPAAALEALVLEAVALHRLGEGGAAQRLSEALAIAGRRLDAFALVPRAELLDLGRQVPGAEALLHDQRLVAVGDVYPDSLAIIELTQRERVILRHLAEGITLQGIAFRETVSINTVKTQVRSLYQKLGATDREHALQVAAHEGLTSS